MGRLKNKNSEKCFSLLRQFIENAEAGQLQKETAYLVLEQLKKITAGTDTGDPGNLISNHGTTRSCEERPRVF